MTYSRKVFIPLTELCRDVCHYCTYAKTPRRLANVYLSAEQVLAIARAGQAAGCHEALFTLGDKPELRYRAARDALATLGYASTLDYLRAMAELVRRETGLLPHLNAGVHVIRRIPAACAKSRPRWASCWNQQHRDSRSAAGRTSAHRTRRRPSACSSIRAAGQARVPLTSGLLIGIGETREERLLSLLALRDLHAEHGHLQELILQNFVPKAGTKMANAPAPHFDELLWTIAMARHIFGAGMSLQAPPNLNTGRLAAIIDAGCNDWGGVSPVTRGSRQPRIALATAGQPRRADRSGRQDACAATDRLSALHRAAPGVAASGTDRQRAETRRCQRPRAHR